MFKNEGGTWDAGTSYITLRFDFLPSGSEGQAASGSRGFGPLTFNKMGEVACAR